MRTKAVKGLVKPHLTQFSVLHHRGSPLRRMLRGKKGADEGGMGRSTTLTCGLALRLSGSSQPIDVVMPTSIRLSIQPNPRLMWDAL